MTTVYEAWNTVMADVQGIRKGERNPQQGELRYKHVKSFWERVAVGNPDECWEWLGAKQTRNRACCNPAHHEVVTRAENGRRGERTRTTRSGGKRRA